MTLELTREQALILLEYLLATEWQRDHKDCLWAEIAEEYKRCGSSRQGDAQFQADYWDRTNTFLGELIEKLYEMMEEAQNDVG